jgi:biopolymer transport protein ExbD
MRFKRQQRPGQIPEVNLVPMLDVLMVVLTFFIIVSMTLTTQQGLDVQLPASTNEPVSNAEPEFALVKLNTDGVILFDEQPATREQLTAQVKTFLEANPKGFVVMQADEKLPYEQVVTLLGELKQVGGERVSLAIE